jgi:hypothetical protein
MWFYYKTWRGNCGYKSKLQVKNSNPQKIANFKYIPTAKTKLNEPQNFVYVYQPKGLKLNPILDSSQLEWKVNLHIHTHYNPKLQLNKQDHASLS